MVELHKDPPASANDTANDAANDIEWGASMLEVAAASDSASRLPPAALVGQWVTVEGRGLGRVVAFNKEWLPGTDSLRT